MPGFTALVMAGSRPSGDPLAQASGVAHKALISIAGQPMLGRVVGTLLAARPVRRVVICGLAATDVPAGLLPSDRRIEFVAGAASPGASAAKAIDTLALTPPLLIATADHPLLTAAMVEEVCDAGLASTADVGFGLTAAAAVSALFPGIRRTVHRFRDGGFCGCNLYTLLTPAGCRAPDLWMQIERHRKKPWRMIGMLGVGAILRYASGRLALADVGTLLQRRVGLRAAPVFLSDPAAGFDVDTVVQRDAADAYLRAAAKPLP